MTVQPKGNAVHTNYIELPTVDVKIGSLAHRLHLAGVSTDLVEEAYRLEHQNELMTITARAAAQVLADIAS